MNTTINHIPNNWNYNCRISYLIWMSETIKSVKYSKIID